MASYTVPFVDQQVDTNDPGGSAKNAGLGVAAVMTLFAIVGVASVAYNRVKQMAGVDAETNIPGV